MAKPKIPSRKMIKLNDPRYTSTGTCDLCGRHGWRRAKLGINPQVDACKRCLGAALSLFPVALTGTEVE